MEEIHVKHRELAKEMILLLQRAGNRLDRQNTEAQLFNQVKMSGRIWIQQKD